MRSIPHRLQTRFFTQASPPFDIHRAIWPGRVFFRSALGAITEGMTVSHTHGDAFVAVRRFPLQRFYSIVTASTSLNSCSSDRLVDRRAAGSAFSGDVLLAFVK